MTVGSVSGIRVGRNYLPNVKAHLRALRSGFQACPVMKSPSVSGANGYNTAEMSGKILHGSCSERCKARTATVRRVHKFLFQGKPKYCLIRILYKPNFLQNMETAEKENQET
jgi:hypothetical protein